MTTIACNRELMAADSICTADNESFKVRKIFRKGGAIIGGAGECADIQKFVAWHGSKDPMPDLGDEFTAVVLTANGIFTCTKDCQMIQVLDPYYAIGSGRQGAMVAMDKGDGPRLAVAAACRRDLYSGGKIDVLKLKGN
jgi:ATP-dependent protease HslVU (ClpYQ) peptidase subunit